MHVVDTNVVVRYVTNDDPVQSPLARRFIDMHPVRVAWTVILETEWVLRSAHGLSRERVLDVISRFVRLPGLSIDDPVRFAAALEWFGRGMDLADAMHLVGCDEGDEFVTFDRKLAAAAQRAKAGKVKLL